MRRSLHIWDVLGAVMLAGLAGCAQTRPVAHSRAAVSGGNQGGAWELILGSPDAPPIPDWEYARLDDAMNIRGNAVEEPQPSLDDLRRLYLNPRPDQILYFRRPAW